MVVIGAGVVGLAIARALALANSRRHHHHHRRHGGGGNDVLVLEKNSNMGMETTSRNSQVIHGGLYYPNESRKAHWCVQGRDLLYRYCMEKSIPFQRCGKLVVATSTANQARSLQELFKQARRNGVSDVELITDQARIRGMEPELSSDIRSALWSPSTGILENVHELLFCLLADAEATGTTSLAVNTRVVDARISKEGRVQLLTVPTTAVCSSYDEDRGAGVVHITSTTNDDAVWLDCDAVVNAAGLWADQIARLIHRRDHARSSSSSSSCSSDMWQPPRQYFCKGTYFRLQGQLPPFRHLVYPVPDPGGGTSGGLGIHATLDGAGQIKFGPDVEWMPPECAAEDIRYDPDPSRSESFYASIRRYWPDLQDGALVPDYCGVRPKLLHPHLQQQLFLLDHNTSKGGGEEGRPPNHHRAPASAPFRDFCIAGPKDHRIPGLVHLLGMESPGLTSALAIAEHVAAMILDDDGP